MIWSIRKLNYYRDIFWTLITTEIIEVSFKSSINNVGYNSMNSKTNLLNATLAKTLAFIQGKFADDILT